MKTLNDMDNNITAMILATTTTILKRLDCHTKKTDQVQIAPAAHTESRKAFKILEPTKYTMDKAAPHRQN